MEQLPQIDHNATTGTPMRFTSKAKQANEIDWFNFETRMRKTVAQMLEPVQQSALNDQEEVISLKQTISQLERKIEKLNYELERTDAKAGQVAEIKLRLQSMVYMTAVTLLERRPNHSRGKHQKPFGRHHDHYRQVVQSRGFNST